MLIRVSVEHRNIFTAVAGRREPMGRGGGENRRRRTMKRENGLLGLYRNALSLDPQPRPRPRGLGLIPKPVSSPRTSFHPPTGPLQLRGRHRHRVPRSAIDAVQSLLQLLQRGREERIAVVADGRERQQLFGCSSAKLERLPDLPGAPGHAPVAERRRGLQRDRRGPRP